MSDAVEVGKAAQAFELRKAGVAYVTIAERLGFADAEAVRAVVAPLLEAALEDDRRESAGLELLRVDGMLTGLYAKARAGDVRSADLSLRLAERKRLLQFQIQGDEHGQEGGG